MAELTELAEMTPNEALRVIDAHLAALDLLMARLLADAANANPAGSIADILVQPKPFVLSAETMEIEGDARVLMQGTLARLLENAALLRQNVR